MWGGASEGSCWTLGAQEQVEMMSPGPTGTPQQDQPDNSNLITSAADVKSLWRVTQPAFVSAICPPEGLSTVDRTTTHRTAFFTALYYQHRLSLLPSEPPWTYMDTGRTIPTATGGDSLTLSTAGLAVLQRGVCPLNIRGTEEEVPLLLCPATLQTGTTGKIIKK